MLVKLKAAGSIQAADTDVSGDSETAIERMALLVYAGQFDSIGGPVTVTPEHLMLLVANHNSTMGKVKRLASGALPLKSFPPVQLDHSVSARDTVGRLTGDLTLADHELEDGTRVPGVYSKLRIVGRDNVERVNDGRWTHLSLGADFELGKISELSITPFPAAANASMLGGKPSPDPKEKEPPMDLTKLKAYLTGHRNMTESEADAHLAKCGADETEMSKLAAECDENDKKLAAEKDEKDKTELAAKEAKLTAARASLVTLSAGFTTLATSARLAARQGTIITRLSRLRAACKVTPAEIKKLDLTKLAAEPEAVLEATLKTYEAREPVIMIGQLGSINGVDPKAVEKKARMSRLEAETRANMSVLAKKPGGAKLAEGEGEAEKPGNAEPPPPPGANRPDVAAQGQEDNAYLEREYGEITNMMSVGDWQQASTRLKAFMTKCLALSGGGAEYTEANGEETEKQLAALQDSVTKMQESFSEVYKLAGSLAGVTA